MAPVAPLGKARALAQLAAGRLPVWLGSPHPHVAIVEQDGVFRVRALVVDPEESRRKGREALAKGENWMPEHHYALARPTGPIFHEAPTREALAAKLAALDWPDDW